MQANRPHEIHWHEDFVSSKLIDDKGQIKVSQIRVNRRIPLFTLAKG